MINKKSNTNWLTKFVGLIGSKGFFIGTLICFGLGAVWIALASRYPMAADEDFHFGLIKLYAHHLSPFWSVQPAEGNIFGALIRDPSYLYHYIFGVLYRLLSLVVHSEQWQVISLRLVNVGLFMAGIVSLREAFRRYNTIGRATLNLVLCALLLVPMVSQVAAQINYDNLLFLIIAMIIRCVLAVSHGLERKALNAQTVVALLLLFLFGSLVKFTLLPVAGAVLVFLLIRVNATTKLRPALTMVLASFRRSQKIMQVAIVAALLIAGGLWFERYGLNLARYHAPTPACNRVISEQSCLSYGPWRRNYYFKLEKARDLDTNVLRYTKLWSGHITWSLFYVLNGPFSNYQVAGPLWLLLVTARVLLVCCLLVVVLRWRLLWREPVLQLLILIIGFYVAALFARNYTEFRDVGQPVAIQGRYLIPMIFPLGVLSAHALKSTLTSLRLKTAFAIIAVMLLLQGGGALSFVLLTNQDWYWYNSTIQTVNSSMRRVLRPLVYKRLAVES